MMTLPEVQGRPGFPSRQCYQRPDGNFVIRTKEAGERHTNLVFYVLSPEQWQRYLSNDGNITWALAGVGLRRTRRLFEALTIQPK